MGLQKKSIDFFMRFAQVSALRAAECASHSELCFAQRNMLRTAEYASHSGLLLVLLAQYHRDAAGTLGSDDEGLFDVGCLGGP